MESRQNAVRFGRERRRQLESIAIPLALLVIFLVPNSGRADDTAYGASGGSSVKLSDSGFAREAPQMAPVPEPLPDTGPYSAPSQAPYSAPGAQPYPRQGPESYQTQMQGQGQYPTAPPYQGGNYPAFQYPTNQESYEGGGGYGGGYGSAYGGPTPYQSGYQPAYQSGAYNPPYQDHRFYSGRLVTAPQGLMMPISLQTAISTQVAKAGDYIQATISQNIPLDGGGYIPSGTQVVGSVTESEAGRRLSRSGDLSIQFNSLRMPNGTTIPINAHLVGGIGKYKNKGSGTDDRFRGEGWEAKLGQGLLRGGLGAGMGAGLGTAVGAIAGGGYGAGRGAWSGAAIGGGIGAADMLLRKGRDVIIPSGTTMQIQLDDPATISGVDGSNFG